MEESNRRWNICETGSSAWAANTSRDSSKQFNGPVGRVNLYDSRDQEALHRCLADLATTDPRDDKARIQSSSNGGLLQDSHRWILDIPDFKQWCDNWESRLLWVKGGFDKDRTMLLCDIIDKLGYNQVQSTNQVVLISYFFCQDLDARTDSVTAVLRGLIFMLVTQQRLLATHVQKRYNDVGKRLFEDLNAWTALTGILESMLLDPALAQTYLIIDGLDECRLDLTGLLQFIVRMSTRSPHKWIVSSAKRAETKEILYTAPREVRGNLELGKGTAKIGDNRYERRRTQAELGADWEGNDIGPRPYSTTYFGGP